MLNFHCHSCNETFRIAFENLHDKEKIQCQNCGHTIPSEAVEALKRFSEAYMDAVDALKRTGEYQRCWSISVVERSEPVPEPVKQYDHIVWGASERKQESYWPHRRKPFEPETIEIDEDL